MTGRTRPVSGHCDHATWPPRSTLAVRSQRLLTPPQWSSEKPDSLDADRTHAHSVRSRARAHHQTNDQTRS
jgi:hypothetical protein